MKFSEYIKTITPGESVLIEHSAVSLYPLLFYLIGQEKEWKNILVIDVLDSALPVFRQLKAANLDVPLEKLDRVKAGGTSEWGKKILEVDPHEDPGIFMTRFLSKLTRYYHENKGVTTFIINPERVIPLQDNKPSFILYLANTAAGFLGDPSRTTFYFVNFEIANRKYLALLEECFTRVLRINERGEIKILKSINTDEEGNILEPK
ncbi:DUF257 family protein [Thermococcus gorgonarius]|uniref:KaiC-like domain-containing protein n=1 Tax=Thermococcus gorgonarius TaxID=71997 RepID=A0A2Z2M8H1_THEGO|nr:DUF257 family protein [Thermococcus gorgonarius]ASJ01643.1 hypothetical protein A3K92_09195 [Thermococcus gorgonarius]